MTGWNDAADANAGHLAGGHRRRRCRARDALDPSLRSDAPHPGKSSPLRSRTGSWSMGRCASRRIPTSLQSSSSDSAGVYRGIIADYFHLIEQRLGAKIEIVRYGTWDEVLVAARAGEIDGVTAAQITPNRELYLDYTAPILDIPNVIVMRTGSPSELSLGDLDGKRVCGDPGQRSRRAHRPQLPGHPAANRARRPGLPARGFVRSRRCDGGESRHRLGDHRTARDRKPARRRRLGRGNSLRSPFTRTCLSCAESWTKAWVRSARASG